MNIKIGSIAHTYMNKIHNNREIALSTVSTMSKPEENKPSTPQDPRLRDPKLNRAVKTVMHHLGIDNPTHKDFNDMQGYKIDWIEFADRIERPRWVAILTSEFSRLVTPLFGATREEAKKTIPKGYQFQEWF